MRQGRTLATIGAAVLLGSLTLAPTAGAGLLNTVLDGGDKTVKDATGSLGVGGQATDQRGSTTASPAPTAGVPPSYTPPLHGTNPHGQGTVGVIDITPEETAPLEYEPGGGSEDVVVGRARGEQDGDSYRGQITIVALLGNEILGVETEEGESAAGPLDPIQENILDALCSGSGDQICLEVLRADSETDKNGSTNSFAVLDAEIGGEEGITATAAESNGNIGDDGQCQTAHGDSTVADASVGGVITAGVLQSESTSEACNDGSESVSQDSTVIELFDTGLPVPVAGCADGTPNSEFTPLLPLLAAVCNADDTNGAQTAVPYGVREALSLFVLDLGGTALLKATTAASESHARAPGDDGPNGPGPGGPNGDRDDDDGDRGDEGDEGLAAAGGPAGPAGPGDDAVAGPGADRLPFSGADVLWLALIGLAVMGTGLGAMALLDRRREAATG